MENLFPKLVFGHLAGDYLFQSKSMALKKSQKGLGGTLWCTFHCLIYAACVCLFLWTIDPLVITLVFLSHWPVDRWSLATFWLKFIRGRDFLAAYNSTDKYREIDLAFSCLVYAVVDNTIHLISLWQIGQWLL